MKNLALLLLALLLIIFGIFSLGVGSLDISILQVCRHFLGFENLDSINSYIITQIRAPRVLAAIFIGAALATSGAIYQGVMGNPLVSPGILGVLNGASFGAILALVFGFDTIGVQVFCFLGGILAVAICLVLSYAFDRSKSLLMLILSGIIISAFFGASVSILKLLADPYNTLPNIVFWLMGSLAYVKFSTLLPLILVCIASAIFCAFFHRQLDIISLDEQSAKTLGVNVRVMRLSCIFFATILASSAVALGGLIGWVGLVIPHIARFLVGSSARFLLPFSAVLGAVFLLLCDNLARSIADTEIPIGILTSIFGIVIFSGVLISKRR